MRIAIIGKGNVGKALGPAFKAAGHAVTYGVRHPDDPKYAGDDGIALATPGEAAAGAEAIVLAVKWSQAVAALAELGDIGGKILIDCNNPVDIVDGSPVERLPPEGSLGQAIAASTRARVVKAFNQVGARVMAHAHEFQRPPLQFLAGDDAAAREAVAGLLGDVGFAPVDLGGIDMARHMESLAYLWIFQAFKCGMPQDSAWFTQGIAG